MSQKPHKPSHLTREHQRRARAAVKAESLSRSGRLGALATLRKHSPDALFNGARRWRLEHPSRWELLMIGILSRMQIGYERECRIGQSLYTVDFYFPQMNRAIEVNGTIHLHNKPNAENRARSFRRKMRLLQQQSIPVMVITCDDLSESRIAQTIEQVRNFLV
jgi:very-short-patch-repair endonuclease